ncbi:MAG: hypothetical protein WC998_07530 [Candidatus Paceibacterota bacterium]|jgi:hypothetical protein
MNAKELRIGNLVIWNGDPEESGLICPIDGEDIDKMERSEFYSKEHSPIPLTEEWLLKFGLNPANSGWYSIDTRKFEFEILLRDGKYKVYVYNSYLCDIFYVHQLQNLYFALTSEELIMKEEK